MAFFQSGRACNMQRGILCSNIAPVTQNCQLLMRTGRQRFKFVTFLLQRGNIGLSSGNQSFLFCPLGG